jgi:predicted nucleic-acid-binding Zn-ribbon protein
MQKTKCPKCSSEELEDDMITIYGMWGELVDTEQVKKCGELIREGEKSEDESI